MDLAFGPEQLGPDWSVHFSFLQAQQSLDTCSIIFISYEFDSRGYGLISFVFNYHFLGFLISVWAFQEGQIYGKFERANNIKIYITWKLNLV